MLETCDGSYSQKIVNWFCSYGGWVFDNEDNTFTYGETTLSAERYQECRAETMFDLTPDAAPKPFNLPDAIKALLTRAEARKAKANEDDLIPTTLLASLKAIA